MNYNNNKPENNNNYNQEGTLYSANQPGRQVKVRYHADTLYPGYFDRDQLYNLSSDPNEQVNLAGDAEYAAKLKEMQELLASYLKEFPHGFGEFTKE